MLIYTANETERKKLYHFLKDQGFTYQPSSDPKYGDESSLNFKLNMKHCTFTMHTDYYYRSIMKNDFLENKIELYSFKIFNTIYNDEYFKARIIPKGKLFANWASRSDV